MRRIAFCLALLSCIAPAVAQTPSMPIGPAGGGASSGGAPPGGSSGQVQENNGAGGFGGLSNAQLTALINAATASLSGALPAWPNNTTTFFRGDGTYANLNYGALGGSIATTNLSDVSSGSWTPTDNSGASLVFTGISAAYTKIGNIVFAYMQLTYPATADGSNASLAGLPFAVPSHNYAQQCSVSYSTGATNARYAVVVAGAFTISLFGAAGLPLTNTNLSTTQLNLMCVYPAA